MLEQINSKLEQGFSCIKMKIGAIDFERELELLAYIRRQFSKEEIGERVGMAKLRVNQLWRRIREKAQKIAADGNI